MAIPPVTGSESVAVAANDEASFDLAIKNAQEAPGSGEVTPELEEMMIEGAVTIGGQMIIMPRANDILNEAMSDE